MIFSLFKSEKSSSKPEWSLPLLQSLEWRRFELLIEGLFRHGKDWRAEGGAAGADGGIDLLLFAQGETKPTAAVQCKAYRSKQVGVAIVRELYGVMAADGIPHGMVFTCGEFSADAERFAENKSVDLVSGPHLLALIGELSPEAQSLLLKEITAGDYTTPTCPGCRVKLVRRESERGAFWGCVNYPRCKTRQYAAEIPEPTVVEEEPAPRKPKADGPHCAACDVPVDDKVAFFCRLPKNREKFGGKVLCRDCQPK